MKTIASCLLLSAAISVAAQSDYVNFIRQTQQTSGVVWDMPVAVTGTASSVLALEQGGSLFQLWTVNQVTPKDYLLDQKLVGAYLPTADVKITTLDPYTVRPRTRIDKPFTVDVTVGGLMSGTGLPEAATKVLFEQHIQNYTNGVYSLSAASVIANTPTATAYLTTNGKTTLKYAASSLKASDPTKATGEEHFVVHALADATFVQSQIASASVQVWPVASGTISGITPNQEYRYQLPTIQLNMYDLYPRSDTYLMLYEGSAATGTGTMLAAYPMDRDTTQTLTMTVSDWTSKITKDGTYTVALVSNTVYGSELLATPITFSVIRTISVNALQVNYTDGQ